MAILNGSDMLTVIELVRRANEPDPFKIIELLRLKNQMLMDLPAVACNSGTIHKTLVRDDVPGGTHRIYDQGVGKKSSQTRVIEDHICTNGAYSVVDRDAADDTGNPAALRNSEAIAIIKGIGRDQAHDLIYGNRDVDKASINGLFTRLNKLSGGHVVDFGGAGNALTSIYLVAAGTDLCHLIYPSSWGTIGVKREDRGVQEWTDPADGTLKYQAYVDFFEARYGIAIRVPDAVWRIANIPATATGDDIVEKVLETRRKMPDGAGTYSLYANVDSLIKIDKAAYNKGNVIYQTADPWGKEITNIRDIRCRQMDVILSTESAVA